MPKALRPLSATSHLRCTRLPLAHAHPCHACNMSWRSAVCVPLPTGAECGGRCQRKPCASAHAYPWHACHVPLTGPSCACTAAVPQGVAGAAGGAGIIIGAFFAFYSTSKQLLRERTDLPEGEC